MAQPEGVAWESTGRFAAPQLTTTITAKMEAASITGFTAMSSAKTLDPVNSSKSLNAGACEETVVEPALGPCWSVGSEVTATSITVSEPEVLIAAWHSCAHGEVHNVHQHITGFVPAPPATMQYPLF